jgi:hypothetical protein
MAEATRHPPLTLEHVLDSLSRLAPEFVAIVRERGSAGSQEITRS